MPTVPKTPPEWQNLVCSQSCVDLGWISDTCMIDGAVVSPKRAAQPRLSGRARTEAVKREAIRRHWLAGHTVIAPANAELGNDSAELFRNLCLRMAQTRDYRIRTEGKGKLDQDDLSDGQSATYDQFKAEWRHGGNTAGLKWHY